MPTAASAPSPLPAACGAARAGNSMTNERIDHKSGAALRVRGLTATGATIITPPWRCRHNASRRSLRRSKSSSHAPVQVPGCTACNSGESVRIASTHTRPFVAMEGSNSTGNTDRNSAGVSGAITLTERALNLRRRSALSRNVAAILGDWQNRNPSQNSAAHSTCRRSRCHCASLALSRPDIGASMCPLRSVNNRPASAAPGPPSPAL